MGSIISRSAASGTRSTRKYPSIPSLSSATTSPVYSRQQQFPQQTKSTNAESSSSTTSTVDAPPPTASPTSTKIKMPGISIGKKPEEIIKDSSDPDFQTMLRTIGPVDLRTGSNSTIKPIGAHNKNQPSLPPNQIILLERRQGLENKMSMESHDKDGAQRTTSRQKRNWIDTGTVRQVLTMRDEFGWDAERIERELGLKEGVVERLGRRVASL